MADNRKAGTSRHNKGGIAVILGACSLTGETTAMAFAKNNHDR